MSVRRGPRTVTQPSLVREGMLPDAPAETDMTAVFAVWVERVADHNLAAELLNAGVVTP